MTALEEYILQNVYTAIKDIEIGEMKEETDDEVEEMSKIYGNLK